MHNWQCFIRWVGFFFLALWLLPSLATEAQVRVTNRSKDTVPSLSRSSSPLTQPTVDVPANAILDYTGRTWECEPGYHRSGKTCVVVQIPANATLDYSGHAWECRRGYHRSGKGCVAVQMPANAILDYSGHAWECQHGYHRSGKTCVVVQMPANAILDYSGHAWECKHGYRRSGKGCVAVQMPANAILDYSGHTWECQRGYNLVGDTCEKITALTKTAVYDSSTVQESRVDPQQQSDSKEEIRQIQKQLKKAGFDPGPMDGIFGPRTMKALRLYLVTR